MVLLLLSFSGLFLETVVLFPESFKLLIVQCVNGSLLSIFIKVVLIFQIDCVKKKNL